MMAAFRTKFAAAVCALAAVVACEESKTPVTPSGSGSGAISLTAPTPETPSEQEQLTTLRPTLTIRNASSDQSGIRTYDFQISTRADFSSPAVSVTGIAEGTAGTTSYTPIIELAGTTRFYWRARAVQATSTSAWSTARTFNSKIVGYNRPGELYDPLSTGETIGTPVGATTFVPGQGLRIENERSYVAYPLAQTIASGEISVEVQGLRPNGPNHKLKVFSMLDGPGDLIASRFQMAAHYRGVTGNPDNCIAFKVTWGNLNVILEPDFAQRSQAIINLDPSRVYLWRGIWTSNSFRLVVTTGGAGVYDRTFVAPAGSGQYAPSPHFAYLGATSGFYNSDAGSWPGVVYRNLWVGSGPRPESLGTVSSVR
jgi:hypothetical protein